MDKPATSAQVIDRYRDRLGQLEQQIDELSRRWNRLGMVRGTLFLVSLVLLVTGLLDVAQAKTLLLTGAGIVFAIFLAAAVVHENLEQLRFRRRVEARQVRHAWARCRRDWTALPEPDVEFEDRYQWVVADLDLIGRASLFQMIGFVQSQIATRLLRDWILKPADADTVKQRQQAVAELRDLPTFRNRLQLVCGLLTSHEPNVSQLKTWAEEPNWLQQRRWIVWMARVLAAAMAGVLIATISGWIPLKWGGPMTLLILMINFVISVVLGAGIHQVFNRVSRRYRDTLHFRDWFKLVETTKFTTPLLCSLQDTLRAGKDPEAIGALQGIHGLGNRVWMANLRRDSLLFLAYLALQFLFLWDIHVLDALEKWKARYGHLIPPWLDNLAQWETLSALGETAYNHPEWVFPEVENASGDDVQIVAQSLGHPLLPHDQRVCNDVHVGPPGTVLLVTGSNMSGKSTLLRALGINVVLAQLGSVVCANSMKLPPLTIETSMRIRDSLADGVSFYMAELRRLKQIVDTAHNAEKEDPRTLLFLLDEILQGTNSRERHIAVARVVEHLVAAGCIGAVSTHDLDLATEGKLADACRCVHFRETFESEDGQRKMKFDYLMRDGIATSTNALELLKLVGLDD